MKRRLKEISGFEKKFELGKSEMIEAKSLKKRGPFKPEAPRNTLKIKGKNGWGGRIRTSESRFQRPVSYRLTTPQLFSDS